MSNFMKLFKKETITGKCLAPDFQIHVVKKNHKELIQNYLCIYKQCDSVSYGCILIHLTMIKEDLVAAVMGSIILD